MKKTVRRRVAKDSTARLDESGATSLRQSGVIDARAELLRSAPIQPTQPPHSELKVANAASGLDTDTARISAAFISAHAHRPASTPSQVDVDQLLAAPPANDVATSSEHPIMPMGVRLAKAGHEAPSQTATWLGVLLMMLGMLSIISSSRSLRNGVRLRS
ncbi:hypothetical protein [Bradyrhizobium sp. CCBAU 65884]|uniref:hypothetical protein n=1 Tax=Bradyrhizobium sp. CCBAU 65884 TaxID=722477 RepID=UPI0023054870|nr:hypothetical protein [Bradyrhizobium sp. CCBAU 65884]